MDPNSENYTNPTPPPSRGKYFEPTVDKLMSVKDWVITWLIMCIPCAGIIMTFVWAFSEENLTRRNFCRAYLIIAGIGIAVGIFFVLFITMLRIFSCYYW